MLIVNTVDLLRLIHMGFAVFRETKDDDVYDAAQSLLSALMVGIRYPRIHMDKRHRPAIEALQAAVRRHRPAGEGDIGPPPNGQTTLRRIR